MNSSEASLAVEAAMTEDEKAKFLIVFCDLNPHYKGAHVADVLDELNGRDAHCDQVELMLQTHVPAEDDVLVATAIRACLYLHHPRRYVWQDVAELLSRVRKLT